LLLDFAPDEVYRAIPVARSAVGSYPTFSPLPGRCLSGRPWSLPLANNQDRSQATNSPAVSFLWPCLSPCGARGLPGVILSGARTFLRQKSDGD